MLAQSRSLSSSVAANWSSRAALDRSRAASTLLDATRALLSIHSACVRRSTHVAKYGGERSSMTTCSGYSELQSTAQTLRRDRWLAKAKLPPQGP